MSPRSLTMPASAAPLGSIDTITTSVRPHPAITQPAATHAASPSAIPHLAVGVAGSLLMSPLGGSSFIRHLFGGADPAPPLPAIPAPDPPASPPVQIPTDAIQRALHERYPRQTENALLMPGSDRLHELENKVEKQLVIARDALDDPRAHTIWSYPTPRHCATDTCYDAAHATLYTRVGQEHTGFLTAFDPDGRVRWSHPGEAATSPPVLGSDGTVYFRTKGWLHACNPQGEEKWKTATTADSAWDDRPPAIAADGTAYVIDEIRNLGQADNLRLRAVRDGREIWHFDAVGDYTGDPQVLVGRDGTVYLTAEMREREHTLGGLLLGDRHERAYLIALRPNGRLKFKAPVTSWPSYVATSLAEGPDGTIYACHGEKNLTAFTPQGHSLWTYRMENRFHSDRDASAHARLTQAPAFDANGGIYLATNTCASYPEGYLVRLDDRGRERWVRSVAGGFSSRPHVGPDGRIYVTTSRGELRAFDADGNQKSAAVVGDVSWSNFCFDPDGELLLNTDRQIVAYQPDAAKAKEKIFAPEPEPPGAIAAPDARVRDDGDYVAVGGVRLRKRPAQ